jgi:hypothetical protein
VELVRGAPEIVAFGADSERLADVQEADHTLVSLAPRDASSTGAASELIADVFSAARERSVFLITHRTEGRELVDRVVSLAPPGTPSSIRRGSPR